MLISFLLSVFSVFGPVQDQPQFKGRLDDFLSINMIYPDYSRQNCLQGTVQVSFSLSSKGRIYRSSVSQGYGTDLDKEALRLIRLTSGRWRVPASFDTTAAIVLPVKFTLPEGTNCTGRGASEISAAIAAYRSYENLTKAITNFYDNKLAGRYDAASEPEILALKEQLGYNDKFVSALIKQAMRKLKQGDKEGACEDLTFVRRLGSTKADALIASTCK